MRQNFTKKAPAGGSLVQLCYNRVRYWKHPEI